MSTAAAQTHPRMTVEEFSAWSENLPDEVRYELVAGVPLRLMAPTKIRHARIQRNVSDALRVAIAAAGRSCEVFDAGPGVAVGLDGDECRIPDVVVTCETAIDDTARLVPEPVSWSRWPRRRPGSPTSTTRPNSTGAFHRSSTTS